MARQFNGTNQALQSSAVVNLSSAGTGAVTVAFWLWWDAFANDDDLAMEHSANYNSNAGTFIINPNDSVTGRFAFAHCSGALTYRQSSFTRPSAAAWHHYALVFSTTAASSMVAYVDGSTVTLTNDANTGGTTWGSFTLNVMCRNVASLFGAGRMCGLGIWASALSAGNVTSLAGGAAPSTIGTPLYAWNICGGSSPEPASVGSPTLTVTGATQVANPAAFAAVCAVGHAPPFFSSSAPRFYTRRRRVA